MPVIFLEPKYQPTDLILQVRNFILHISKNLKKKYTINSSPMSSIYSIPNKTHQSIYKFEIIQLYCIIKITSYQILEKRSTKRTKNMFPFQPMKANLSFKRRIQTKESILHG